MAEDTRVIARMLKVLSNEHRLNILCELITGPKTVSALGEKIDTISQSALSQHLALLKAHGIVDDTKNGQSVTYSIADMRVEAIIDTLKEYYCKCDGTGEE
ncbi:MAG: metalloregulator ArsR/SmtB family transcription factor [Eubacteriales bacterium]|nr:metalloregulator ArsR/SmtB family transcription factor [Eubacteriales bacterium]